MLCAPFEHLNSPDPLDDVLRIARAYRRAFSRAPRLVTSCGRPDRHQLEPQGSSGASRAESLSRGMLIASVQTGGEAMLMSAHR